MSGSADRDIETLRREVTAWMGWRNEALVTVHVRFTPRDARQKLARSYQKMDKPIAQKVGFERKWAHLPAIGQNIGADIDRIGLNGPIHSSIGRNLPSI